jgi:predicted amidohydrolase YtcJ
MYWMKCCEFDVLELALEDVHKKVDLIAMTRATARKPQSQWSFLFVFRMTADGGRVDNTRLVL